MMDGGWMADLSLEIASSPPPAPLLLLSRSTTATATMSASGSARQAPNPPPPPQSPHATSTTRAIAAPVYNHPPPRHPSPRRRWEEFKRYPLCRTTRPLPPSPTPPLDLSKHPSTHPSRAPAAPIFPRPHHSHLITADTTANNNHHHHHHHHHSSTRLYPAKKTTPPPWPRRVNLHEPTLTLTIPINKPGRPLLPSATLTHDRQPYDRSEHSTPAGPFLGGSLPRLPSLQTPSPHTNLTRLCAYSPLPLCTSGKEQSLYISPFIAVSIVSRSIRRLPVLLRCCRRGGGAACGRCSNLRTT